VNETALAVAPDHPSYEGHFPGHPILPGVVLLAEALAAIGAATGRAPRDWTISSAKFFNAVEPGTPLTLLHETQASGTLRFEIRGGAPDAGIVASGTLSPRPAP
jgi:3-hydroxymyristoyl/3-hydroxydecanoyl-(acyl carrier protein) dehydratase